MKTVFRYVALCFSDSEVRFNLGILFGMILNILYISFNFVLGILYGNVWLITVAAYYMLIVILRYMIIGDAVDDSYAPRLVSALLLIVFVPMTGIIIYTVLTDYRGLMPRRIVPVLVFYAVFSLIRAVIGIFTSGRDGKNRKSMHLVRLSLALVSLFNFQVAYLNYISIEYNLRAFINLITGTAVLISVLTLSKHLAKK